MTDEPNKTHPDDERIEEYSLGVLPVERVAGFEQHVLICRECQQRVAEMDAYVRGMQAAARKLREEELRRKGGSTE